MKKYLLQKERDIVNASQRSQPSSAANSDSSKSPSLTVDIPEHKERNVTSTPQPKSPTVTLASTPPVLFMPVVPPLLVLQNQYFGIDARAYADKGLTALSRPISPLTATGFPRLPEPRLGHPENHFVPAGFTGFNTNRQALSASASAYRATDECCAAVERSCATARPTFENPPRQPPGQGWLQFGKYLSPYGDIQGASIGRPNATGVVDESTVDSSCLSNPAEDSGDSLKDAVSEDSRNECLDGGRGGSYSEELRGSLYLGSYSGDSATGHSLDSPGSHSGLDMFKSPTSMRSAGRSRGPKLSRNGGEGSTGGSSRVPKPSGESHSGGRSIIRCPICGKLFNNSSALAKHKLTHSDERKYTCPKCSKAFKRQDHLNGHMMTHSSKKPFECKFVGCTKSYCDARSLRRHLENHHQDYINAATAFASLTDGTERLADNDNMDGSNVAVAAACSPPDISPLDGHLQRSCEGRRSAEGRQRSLSPFSARQIWTTGYNPLDEPKPVKCHVCDRGFKNIAALNGHMRLHGGYVRKDTNDADSETVEMAQHSAASISTERSSGDRHSAASLSSDDARSKSATDNRYPFLLKTSTPSSSSSMTGLEKTDPRASPHDAMISNLRSEIARSFPRQFWPPLQDPAGSGRLGVVGGGISSGENRTEYDSPIRWPELWPIVGRSQSEIPSLQFGRKRESSDAVAAFPRRSLPSDDRNVKPWQNEVDVTSRVFKPWTTPSPALEYGHARYGGIDEHSPPRRMSHEEEEMETRSSSNGARSAEEFRRGLQEVESRKNFSIVSGGSTGKLYRTDITATGLSSVEMAGIWTKVECGRLSAKMEDAPSMRGNPAELSKKGNRTGAVDEMKRSPPPLMKIPNQSLNVSSLLETSEAQSGRNNDQREENNSSANGGILVIKSETQTQQVESAKCLPSEKVIRSSPSSLGESPQLGKSSSRPLSTEKDKLAGVDTTADEPAGKAVSANLPTKSASTSGCENDISSPTESGHEFCIPALPSSGSAEQWESLYRRRVKALLLKQGSSLASDSAATEDIALKSPRLGGQFVTIFNQNGSAAQQSPESDASDGEADSRSNAVVDVGSSEAECRTPVVSSQAEKIPSVHCCSGSPRQVENTAGDEKNDSSLLNISKGNVIKSKSATNLLHDSYFHQCSGAENNHFACHVRDCSSMHCPSTPLAHHCCADASGAHCVTPSCCYPSAKYPTCIAMDLASRCCVTPTARCASVSHCPGSCVRMASHPNTPSCLEVVSGCKRHSTSPCGTPCPTKCRCSAVGGGLLTPSCAGSCKRAAGLCGTPRCLNQPVEPPPHTPCMAHTPYAPRDSLSPRQATEPHTPCEPCTPQDGPQCAAARKHPCTPVSQSCHFQFPPHIPHCETIVCRSPFIPYGRRFMSCHTPCASPLNLTIGHACAVHACPAAVQCCHADQLQWQEQARCSCCTMNQLREDVLEIANRDRDFEQRRRLIEMEVEERMKNAAQQRLLETNQSRQVSGASPGTTAVPLPRATTPPMIVEPDSTMSNELSVESTGADDPYTHHQRPQEDAIGTSDDPETSERPARQKSRDGKRVLVEEPRCDEKVDLPLEKNNFDPKLKKLKRQWEDDYDVNVSRNSEKTACKVDTIKSKYSRQNEVTAAQVTVNRTSTPSSDLSQSLLERWQARQMESYLQDKTPLEILAEMGVDMRREAMRQDAEEQPSRQVESVERFSEPETRKKRRPDPLVMTSAAAAASEDVNNFSYQSYLRSPRICNGGDKIPYTPPPMLSPARHGSGLFWSVARSSAAAGAPSSLRQQTAFSYSEQVNELPPATDVEPHINIGEQFQASLPSIIVSRAGAVKQSDRADLLWRPDIATRPEAGPFDSIALPGGIPNREYAMQLLNLWHGDFKKAMLGLMQTSSQASQAGPAVATQSYSQRENKDWQPDEIERFKTGVLQFNKDFARISAHVGTRTMAECVQHYYAWKKSNVEEYRHLRLLRQRRQQEDEAYNSRSASRGAAGYLPRDGQRSPVAD